MTVVDQHTSERESQHLLVRGGTIVGSAGRFVGDLLVVDGRIAALAAPGTLETRGAVLDADGLLVLPGLVDAHVHLRDPGLTHKEDFGSGTRAAAAGGVTTVLVMPYDLPLTDSAEHLVEKAAIGEAAAFVDFGLQAAVGPANLGAVAELVEAGAVSLEVQLAEAPPAVGLPSAWDLREIMRAARAAGAVVGVYCETESIVAGSKQALLAGGRRDPLAHAESKPPIGEQLGAELSCALALETGAAVHLRQLSLAAVPALAQPFRERGADLSLEVTPHHLLLTVDDEARGGPEAKVSPPLRAAADVAGLRTAVLRREIEIVATDHAPHAPAEKAAGRDDIWQAPGGFPGLETFLSVMLEVFGDAAPELIARRCAEAPARRFGLAGRKGRIAPGLDGDLVLLDPAARWRVDPARFQTKAAYSPLAGRDLPGVVRCTIVRGQVVARDGRIVGPPRGRWLRPNLHSWDE